MTSQTISADRPEHPFLTPVTSQPTYTMLWLVLGVWVSVAWWSKHLASWWDREKTKGNSAQVDEAKKDVLAEIEANRVKPFLIVKKTATALAVSFGASILIYAVIILLGAPMPPALSLKSYLLALEIALLVAYPVTFTLGVPDMYEAGTWDRYRLTRMFCELE